MEPEGAERIVRCSNCGELLQGEEEIERHEDELPCLPESEIDAFQDEEPDQNNPRRQQAMIDILRFRIAYYERTLQYIVDETAQVLGPRSEDWAMRTTLDFRDVISNNHGITGNDETEELIRLRNAIGFRAVIAPGAGSAA